MRRTLVRWVVGGACAALCLGPAVVTPAVSAATPQPLPPAQAQALVDGPAVQSPVVTRPVSAQEALAAASLPGATVYVAPGLSLAQAVGLGPAVSLSTGPSAVVRPAAAAAPACAANVMTTSWGTWPYDQHIADTTYWCAVPGDHITYHSSSVNATGTFCATSWTTSQQISGGIGYSWFVMRSSAGWSCPTVVPYISLHPSHYEDVSRNAWGSTSLVGTG